MTTQPSAAPVSQRERLAAGRLLLRALAADASPAGARYREALEVLWSRAEDALPWVVGKPVEMPYLSGLDVGDRIVYHEPAPFGHVLEYVEAGAQRFSWDDPKGVYIAEEEHPPDERVLGYLVAVRAFVVEWRLPVAATRMLVFEQVQAVAARDRAAGAAALDALAGEPAAEAVPAAPWLARRLLGLEYASIAADLGNGASESEVRTAAEALARRAGIALD